jgi:ribosomal protein L29
MKISEIRKKTDKELQKLLAENRNQLRETRFKVSARQFKDYKKFGFIKKDIARILMVMKENEYKSSKKAQ